MPSRSPAWLGLTRPCSSSRCVPCSLSTMRRTASAAWMVSGSASRVEGTKDSTIMSVSESRNTSFTNSSGPRHSRCGDLPQAAFGDHLKASGPAFFTHAPVGSTKWPCTSKTNSPLPPRAACARRGSSAASFGRSNQPPVFPAAAFAVLNASRVLAAPHADVRKFLRPMPNLLELKDACSCARRLAARFAGDSGTGSNSPLEAVSSLIGRRLPSGSTAGCMADSSCGNSMTGS